MPRWSSLIIIGIILGVCFAGCGGSGSSDGNGVVTSFGTFVATIDGQSYELEYRIDKPDDNGVRPLIVMNHGRNGPHPSRNLQEVNGYSILNKALAARGYVVMMLVRRGYGNSDGPDSELKDTAFDSGMEAAKDVLSAVDFMKTQPFVDPQKIVIMGHSQGGWAALAFATLTVDGVLGVVNLSGGTNYTTIQSDPVPTVFAKWASACGQYGAIDKVPSLWIYAPNDLSIPDEASEPMFQSFQAAGGSGTFVMKPAFGTNGHLFCDSPDFFMNDLVIFFNAIGFTV